MEQCVCVVDMNRKSEKIVCCMYICRSGGQLRLGPVDCALYKKGFDTELVMISVVL
jgi:hypothetical protein